MGGTNEQGLTMHHVKLLLKMMAAGGAFFVGLLLALQVALAYARIALGPSFYDFYPIMAVLGIVFGFERWWAHLQGGVNPFHDN